MASTRVRQIVIDDTDDQIRYADKGWFYDHSGSRDGVGNFGPPYLQTLHGTNLNGTLSYKFQGTSVIVRGTTNLTRTPAGGFDPSWECFVDRISIGAAIPVPFIANNWGLCESPELSDGLHELTINVTTSGGTFWLDYILYTASPTLSLEAAVEVLENDDPGITYDSSWRALGDGNMTQTSGSTATFDFTGTSLSWIGFIPNEYPHGASSGTYAVDEGPSVSFQLKGLPPGASGSLFHQTFFSISELPPGPHSLRVTHQGTSEQTPLTLDYMHVNTTSISDSTPAPTPQPRRHTPSVSAISGGVVGGAILTALALFLLWMYKRRHRRTLKPRLGIDEDDESSLARVSPFVYTPTSLRSEVHEPKRVILAAAPLRSEVGFQQGIPAFTKPRSHPVLTPAISLPHQSHSSLSQSVGHTLTGDVSLGGPPGQNPNTISETEGVRDQQGVAIFVPAPGHELTHQDSGLRLNAESAIDEQPPPRYTAM